MRPPAVSLDSIRRIEQEAYPPFMRSLQDVTSWEEVAEYAECALPRLLVLGEEGQWYAILALGRRGRAEFVDLARSRSAPPLDWAALRAALLSTGVRKIVADTRETTSHKRLMAVAGGLGARVAVQDAWDWGGERMFSVSITLEG